jgi:RNA polymerase-binding transcription factor DksA
MEGTLMSADLAIIPTLSTAQRSPATQGRHLHPAALPQWRALLEFHWRQRLERITALSLAFHEAAEATGTAGAGTGTARAIETGGGSAADRKSNESRRAAQHRANRLLHQTVAERRALADIEAALARLAIGRFGWCEQCGGVIATTRLTETPQVRYCAVCDP